MIPAGSPIALLAPTAKQVFGSEKELRVFGGRDVDGMLREMSGEYGRNPILAAH